MATNLAIDNHLLNEALIIGHHRTKRETVNAALDEYIRKRKQLEVLDLFGKIEFAADYDYKKARKRK